MYYKSDRVFGVGVIHFTLTFIDSAIAVLILVV
jgi:hypothetical protein